MFPLKDNIPTERLPVVTIALIVANVLLYFFWQRGGLTLGDPSSREYLQNLVDYSAIPYELTHPGDGCRLAGETVTCGGPDDDQPRWWLTPFSSMFMHGGLLHLGGNMLFLWIFGNNIEESMGRLRYLVFYLLGGLVALGLQVGIEPDATIPTVGASGAIAAVLGGYLVLFPRARVVTVIFIIFFFTILELPALLILGFWFAFQVLSGVWDLSNPTGGGGGVAYFAHVGGFAFGMLAVKLFARRPMSEPQLQAAWRRA